MSKTRIPVLTSLGVCVIFLFSLVFSAEAKKAERDAMYRLYLDFASQVKGGDITAHWMADGNSFWFADGSPANTVVYKVDPVANTKQPLFDNQRLRKALTPLLGHELAHEGLPFENFSFLAGEKAIRFTVENKDFICSLDTYSMTKPASDPLIVGQKSWMRPQLIRREPNPPILEIASPDGSWFLHEKDHNIWLRSAYDGRMLPFTEDGVEDYEWTLTLPPHLVPVPDARWSPNGIKVAIGRVDSRKVEKFPLVHWLKPVEEIEWRGGFIAGGPMPQAEIFIADVKSKEIVRIDTGHEPDHYFRIYGWKPDGSELLFSKISRDYKKLQLMAADAQTGATRVILTEEEKTFIIGAPYMPHWTHKFTPLPDGKRFLWISERDGWAHLYLYATDGTLLKQLTKGDFPVVQVVSVDEKGGWIYFTAHAEPRPYDTHLYRVNFEGQAFRRLTEASGEHGPAAFLGSGTSIRFSPSKKYFLDPYSSPSRPPKVELRKADRTLLRVLAEANTDGLKGMKWSPPEEFVVKAADKKTDIYGILYKPYDFDPNKKYPVIDNIYGGPQVAVVPRVFSLELGETPVTQAQALAQMGFVVFILDARGTPERSKSFQDAVYGNFGRNEIPDHTAALHQLAAERPYMDLSRVGIFGRSWGGTFTLRAMFTAPDVYHVGVALSPIPDPSRAGFLHEIYLGLPADNAEAYKAADSTPLAAHLKGKLLIVHGTLDAGCRTALQMQLAEALIRAGKFFDLIMLPERGHGLTYSELIIGSTPEDMREEEMYALEATKRYFVEHLRAQQGDPDPGPGRTK